MLLLFGRPGATAEECFLSRQHALYANDFFISRHPLGLVQAQSALDVKVGERDQRVVIFLINYVVYYEIVLRPDYPSSAMVIIIMQRELEFEKTRLIYEDITRRDNVPKINTLTAFDVNRYRNQPIL